MWIKRVIEAFESKAAPERAAKMAAYMKNQFSFIGLASPIRKDIQKPFIKESLQWEKPVLISNLRELWDLDHREYQYLGIDLMNRNKKKLSREDIPTLELMITQKSWWDTVDLIASNLVGPIIKDHNPEDLSLLKQWIEVENIWLNRTAILHQLKYRERLDFEMLKEFIEIKKSHKEFFIQKAIGWALREYSKVNAKGVITFVNNTSDLSGLASREALKWINRQNKRFG